MIGIISGLPEEAAAFAPGQGVIEDCHGLAVRRLDWAGEPVALLCAGIGKVAAATAASLLVSQYHADLLMIIGTAGALVPSDGQPHWLESAVQHDYGAARADGFAHYDAGAWPIGPDGVTAFRSLPQPHALALTPVTIASGDCFVECELRAGTIRDRLGASLVDMETAAMAQVAAMLGLPWCGIKAATDEANGDSAGDFHANLGAAAGRAAAAAERAIPLLIGARSR